VIEESAIIRDDGGLFTAIPLSVRQVGG